MTRFRLLTSWTYMNMRNVSLPRYIYVQGFPNPSIMFKYTSKKLGLFCPLFVQTIENETGIAEEGIGKCRLHIMTIIHSWPPCDLRSNHIGCSFVIEIEYLPQMQTSRWKAFVCFTTQSRGCFFMPLSTLILCYTVSDWLACGRCNGHTRMELRSARLVHYCVTTQPSEL